MYYIIYIYIYIYTTLCTTYIYIYTYMYTHTIITMNTYIQVLVFELLYICIYI